jgi:hypothetical protein
MFANWERADVAHDDIRVAAAASVRSSTGICR